MNLIVISQQYLFTSKHPTLALSTPKRNPNRHQARNHARSKKKNEEEGTIGLGERQFAD